MSAPIFRDREVNSVCPYCGVGCQLTYHIKDDKLLYVSGKDGPANHQRLCVKGRFGFDYVHNPQRLTQPLIRKDGIPKHVDDALDARHALAHFRPATWEEALDRAASGLGAIRDTNCARALAGFGWPRARTRKRICSRSWSAPASAPTMSITAPGCVTLPRWRRSWKASVTGR
jgi:predicted molibdopterin-dependent oxidoreductase YjgC